MLIAILGDLHLGARNSSYHFADYFNRFFNEIFYPYCKKRGIKNVIQLGDTFDSRAALSYKAYHRCRETWFGNLEKNDIQMYMLVGNHDICYRHTLEINSPDLLLGEYKNITIINKPTQIAINGVKIDIVPWVCDENEADITTFMSRKDKGDICCGHFELSGFPMYKGVDSSHGTVKSMKMFEGYDRVFSGHYHTKSEKGNITYIGIPYEITWSDYADPKGFYVYDTTTGKHEFIRNPLTMFEKVVYNNSQRTDISTLKGKIVKILTHEKKDAVLYERWLDSIRLVQPYEFNVVENDAVQLDGELDDSIEIEDTASIIKNYIDQIETSVSKDDLNKYMQALYFEALTLDDSI